MLRDSSLPKVVALLALLAAPSAWSQSAGDEDPASMEALDPISVTGIPLPGDPLSQAPDVSVVAGEEKRRNDMTSLGDSLDHLAGVNNIATGSQTGKPVIRGLSGERVRILSDGIGVDHQQFGVRHMPNIDPFFAERLEVVRGANSVLYGSSALGGAVNVLPPEIPFDQSARGEVLTRFASNNSQFDTGVKVRGGNAHFGAMVALIRRSGEEIGTPNGPIFFPPPPSNADKRDAPAFTRELPFTDFTQVNGQIAGGWRHVKLGAWSLRLTRWDNEHNFLLPPPAGLKPPNEGPEGIGQFLDDTRAQLSGEVEAGEVLLKPKLTWQNNRRRSNTPGIPRRADFDGTIDVEFDQYTARLEGEHGPALGLDGGTVGFEYLDKNQFSRGTTQLTPGGDVTNVALFAFQEKQAGPVLLQGGLRHDFRTVEGRAARTSSPSSAVLGADEETFSVTTGSLGGVLGVTDHLSVAANVQRGFRAPTLFELFVDGVHGGVAAVQKGDPDLDEETSLSTDLSLRWGSRRLTAKATVYRNRIDDFITLFSTGEMEQGLPVFEVGQGNATLYGVELSGDARLTDWLSINAAFETVEGELDENDEDLPLLPADNLRVGFELSRSGLGRLREPYFTTTVRYAADKEAAPREPFVQFDDAPFGTASTDSYVLVDIGLGFDTAIRGQPLSLDLRVTNLFNNDHRQFLDTNKIVGLSPGRDARLSVTVPFGN